MELVLLKNYVALEQDEMMYLDGGKYLSRADCRYICAALAMNPGTFMALASAAVIVNKLTKFFKAGGAAGFLHIQTEVSQFGIYFEIPTRRHLLHSTGQRHRF